MSQESQKIDITKRPVVYRAPGMDAVRIRRDVEYQSGDAGPLTMDLYYPPASESGERLSAVIIVAGFTDFRMPPVLGCKFKEMEWSVSWGKLLAASGMVAILYSAREPASDVQLMLQHVRANAGPLAIDADRIGLLAASGNVPNALSLLMQGRDYLKAAVLCCGFTLDVDGSTTVADAARTFGFVNPAAGKSVDDLSRDTPLLVVRAGQDHFSGLNDAMDRFVAKALGRNLPITLVNHAAGSHGFDLFDDSEKSREIIKQMLAFMAFCLRAA